MAVKMPRGPKPATEFPTFRIKTKCSARTDELESREVSLLENVQISVDREVLLS